MYKGKRQLPIRLEVLGKMFAMESKPAACNQVKSTTWDLIPVATQSHAGVRLTIPTDSACCGRRA